MLLFLLGLIIVTIIGAVLISLCHMAAHSSEDHFYRKFSGKPKGKQIDPNV